MQRTTLIGDGCIGDGFACERQRPLSAWARGLSDKLSLERHFWTYAIVFLTAFLACSVFGSLRIKMWNDELFTLYVARQAGPVEIVKAAMEGVDGAPPLYAILVSSVLPIVRQDALAVRLPATLGFCGMLLCVLAFCRRRMPAVYAFVAALIVCLSCGFYATEGRCYGLVLGCAASALLWWQIATERTTRILALILLGLSLMLMTALHYYSIFFLLPLAVAEAVRWRKLGRLDWAILGAMTPALGVLALHYPLIAAGRRFLPHFWLPGKASWRQIPDFYLSFALVPFCVFVVAVMVMGISSRRSPNREVREPILPAHEWTAIGALALMPIVVVAVAKCTTHVFMQRYALWAMIGLAILTAAFLCFFCSRTRPPALVALGLLAAILVVQQLPDFRREPVLREGEAIRRELQSLPDGPEPIVIGYDHVFMELSYYAEPRLRERLVYPLDRSLDLFYKGFDLDFLNLSALRRRTKLHIVDLDTFLAANSRFVIAAHPKDYLPRHLLEPPGTGWFPLAPETVLRSTRCRPRAATEPKCLGGSFAQLGWRQ